MVRKVVLYCMLDISLMRLLRLSTRPYHLRALTVHKCQGSTVTRAELKIDDAFENGQAYVALSRVSSMEGLWLTTALTQKSVKADPIALDYYDYTAQTD